MKTLFSVMILSIFLLISGCYTNTTKESDSESAEQTKTPASRPATNRY